VVRPDPIPNSAVKHSIADGSGSNRFRESRLPPDFTSNAVPPQKPNGVFVSVISVRKRVPEKLKPLAILIVQMPAD
jgi:hypothetical protein